MTFPSATRWHFRLLSDHQILGKIVLILKVDDDVLPETDSWISRKFCVRFTFAYSSFTKLVFLIPFFSQTNKCHAHTIYDHTCYWMWQGRDWQWWCPSINTSPCQTLTSPLHLSFIHLLKKWARIESCSHVLQHNIIWPKKVENSLFSTLWGSASNLSPPMFAQVNLSNWNPIHLCSGLLPWWVPFP